LIRQKLITVIIDASLDELTGTTIIITTAITDRLSPRLSGARGGYPIIRLAASGAGRTSARLLRS
jgi:hypothetical protein